MLFNPIATFKYIFILKTTPEPNKKCHIVLEIEKQCDKKAMFDLTRNPYNCDV